jgi:hypothetical protein
MNAFFAVSRQPAWALPFAAPGPAKALVMQPA